LLSLTSLASRGRPTVIFRGALELELLMVKKKPEATALDGASGML